MTNNTMKKKIVFIPGNGGGSPNDNWFPFVKKELEGYDITVIAEEFPDNDLARGGDRWVTDVARRAGRLIYLEQFKIRHMKYETRSKIIHDDAWAKNRKIRKYAFKELQKRVRNVSQREEYLEVVEWINKNAPSDGNEEKYDHVTAILEQMSREPKQMPTLKIAKKPFDKLTIDDFVIENYDPHPAIRRNMCV